MRKAQFTIREVCEKVLASLCARMDPETHQVRPSWVTIMRETHVCRQRISQAITILKAEGTIKAVLVPQHNGKGAETFYEILEVPTPKSGENMV